MLRSLLDQAAAGEEGGFRVVDVESGDGGTIAVLLDWDHRPLLFWIDMPGEESNRQLMAAVLAPGVDGIIAMTVDESLRPEHSGEAMARILGEKK